MVTRHVTVVEAAVRITSPEIVGAGITVNNPAATEIEIEVQATVTAMVVDRFSTITYCTVVKVPKSMVTADPPVPQVIF